MTNTNLLRGKIASAGFTQRTLAQALNMSENTLGSRINNHSYFDTTEVIAICNILGITDASEKCEIFLA